MSDVNQIVETVEAIESQSRKSAQEETSTTTISSQLVAESSTSKTEKEEIKSSSSSSSSISSASSSTVSTVTSNQTHNQQQSDEFENLQRAVCILGKAKTLDEVKRYDEALKLYRQGVDMLLEELIVRQGTDQSRTYLRGKCNDFMNRIDQLKLIIQIENATNANKENQSQITNT